MPTALIRKQNHATVKMHTVCGDEVFHDVYYPSEPPECTYVLLPGLATHPRAYASLANHIRSHFKAIVVVVNYRGIGLNRKQYLYNKNISLYDWGKSDLTAVVDWLGTNYKGLNRYGVGHSMGGYLFGFTPRVNDFKSIRLICVPLGRLIDFKFPVNIQYAFYTFVLTPCLRLFSRCIKYSVLKLGEDMPKGVVKQLTRWSKKKNFIESELEDDQLFFKNFRGDLKSIYSNDDQIAPEAAVSRYTKYFTNAKTTTLVPLDPAEHQLKEVGHFGFLKFSVGKLVWHVF